MLEAEEYANSLIGGGVIQEQGKFYHVFGANELKEKIAAGEI